MGVKFNNWFLYYKPKIESIISYESCSNCGDVHEMKIDSIGRCPPYTQPVQRIVLGTESESESTQSTESEEESGEEEEEMPELEESIPDPNCCIC